MRRMLSLIAGAAVLAASGAALAQGRQAPQQDLSRAAVEQRSAQAFQRIDANGDGRLDAADREARLKARFDRVDANGDGSVSFAEFTERRGERAGRARGERDGQGMGRRGMRGAHLLGLRGAARNADANDDGAISQAEFQAAALARFDAADADNDGIVTAAERKARRDTTREQWRERRGQRTS